MGDSWLAWAYYRLGGIEEHLNSNATFNLLSTGT